MPYVPRLIAHIAVFPRISPEERHHQVQRQRAAQRERIHPLPPQQKRQQPLRQQNAQHRGDSQKEGNQPRPVSAQPVEELVRIRRKAVVPSIIDNHADMIGQIRLEVSVVVVQRLDGLHVKKIQAQPAVYQYANPEDEDHIFRPLVIHLTPPFSP